LLVACAEMLSHIERSGEYQRARVSVEEIARSALSSFAAQAEADGT